MNRSLDSDETTVIDEDLLTIALKEEVAESGSGQQGQQSLAVMYVLPVPLFLPFFLPIILFSLVCRWSSSCSKQSLQITFVELRVGAPSF